MSQEAPRGLPGVGCREQLLQLLRDSLFSAEKWGQRCLAHCPRPNWAGSDKATIWGRESPEGRARTFGVMQSPGSPSPVPEVP